MRDGKSHALRKPCKKCDTIEGVLCPTGNQDCVYCAMCDTFQYNAPRTETGREQRSVSTVHAAIKPKQRARVLLRANGCCAICRCSDKPLHVGHMLSVERALSQGLPDEFINNDENLCAMCDECNLGLGKESPPLWLVLGILKARIGFE